MRRNIVIIILFSLLFSSCTPPEKIKPETQGVVNDTIHPKSVPHENSLREVKRVYK